MIHPVSCRRRWVSRTHAVNAAQQPVLVSRQLADGRQQQFFRRPKAINSGAFETAMLLITLNASNFHTLQRELGTEQALAAGLLTNSEALGELRNCSARSVRNHLKTLQEIGFITRKKFRGSRANYELWIDEKILWETPESYPHGAVDNAETATETPSFSAPEPTQPTRIGTFFPHNNVTVLLSLPDTEKEQSGNVDNDTARLDGDTDQQHTPGPAGPAGQPDRDEAGGAAAATRPAQRPGSGSRLRDKLLKTTTRPAQPAPKSPDEPLLWAGLEPEMRRRKEIIYTQSFWAYARQKLYPAERFSPDQTRLILNEIRHGVYRNYQLPFSSEEFEAYNQELFTRIDLVAAYLAKHPEKYLPAPYSVHRPGAGYFCQANANGFRRTDAWLASNLQKNTRRTVQAAVSRAIGQLRLHPQGKARPKYQSLCYLDAFRLLKREMAARGHYAETRFLELVQAELTPDRHIPQLND